MKPLKFDDDEFHEITDEGETSDDIGDYDENEQIDIRNNFTLQEMKVIIDWLDKHPNTEFDTIRNRFRKVKQPNCTLRFRKYIGNNGTRFEKIKKFMTNDFCIKRAIEKGTVHDDDLKFYAIQKAKELDWNTIKGSKSFIHMFNEENRM